MVRIVPRYLIPAVFAVLLQACASAPVEDPQVASGPDREPDLSLNLPEQPAPVCVREEGVDYTFFDKGFSAMVTGDHIEAVDYFQRYQRTESSAVASWEAEIAIAYTSMLPQSPFYDPRAARKEYNRLRKEQPEGGTFNEKTLMMRDALAAFAAMERSIRELRSDNSKLSEDLEKREEALRRLRELTLGQKGATP